MNPMDSVCRLCCSTNFVSNNIFDEETALYLKMSLYLPIKVFKNDRLPQKICDRCSCKVNDFYQFCNEAIEVQNRLRRSLLVAYRNVEPDDSVDLTLIKENVHSPQPSGNQQVIEVSVEQMIEPTAESINKLSNENNDQPTADTQKPQTTHLVDQFVQTDLDGGQGEEKSVVTKKEPSVKVKIEPCDPTLSAVKQEYPDVNNSDSDDMLLANFQKKKIKRKAKINGVTPKKHSKQPIFETIMNDLPEGSYDFDDDTALDFKLQMVKDELMKEVSGAIKQERLEGSDPEILFCCICMMEYKTKGAMLQHYEDHVTEVVPKKFVPPPLPEETPLRCNRCTKVLRVEEWVLHWARHWERDRRPLRCALCRRTFRNPIHMLHHSEQHNRAEAQLGAGEEKKFGCDLCDQSFVHLRDLLSHRTIAHPHALGQQLELRCGECSRTFRHVNSLRRHLRAHSGAREHLCNVCGKALSSREHLKFHIRIHTGYKPNICKTCGKGFVKKCNLTLHERVHSGEKPHVCATCGKAFSQRSTLVIHERYHTGARPYVCALCGRGFVAQGLLSMHLKTTCI